MSIMATEYDRCPACRKKVRKMSLFKEGKMMCILPGVIVCERCGNLFVLKSTIPAAIAKLKRIIKLPGEA